MHQEEIDIVRTQGLEGVVEGGLNILWGVGVVPELGGDEEALAVYSGFFDGPSNCRLRAVDVCSVNVAVL